MAIYCAIFVREGKISANLKYEGVLISIEPLPEQIELGSYKLQGVLANVSTFNGAKINYSGASQNGRLVER